MSPKPLCPHVYKKQGFILENNEYFYVYIFTNFTLSSELLVTYHVPIKNILVALPKLPFKDLSHLDIGRLLFFYKPCHFYLPSLFAEGITKERYIKAK